MYTILTYHTIGDYKNVLPAGINTSIDGFRSHMDYLFRHRCRVIPLDQVVVRMKRGKRLDRKTLAITFDDGYEDHFLHAFPILKKYGFPATIFLAAESINGYWESEKAEGGRIKGLSTNQILELRKGDLIRFGSHGYSHRNLVGLPEEERVFEITNSKLCLEDMLGEDIPFISYPFGASDEGVKNIVGEAGYRAGFSIWSRNPDIYSIRRIPLHTRDDVKRFKFKISPLYHPLKALLRFRNRDS